MAMISTFSQLFSGGRTQQVAASRQVLSPNATRFLTQASACLQNIDLGVDVDMIRTHKVTLTPVLLDTSGSMDGAQHELAACWNTMLEELREAPTRNDILVALLGFNGVIFPYARVQDAPRLDAAMVPADGGTPLRGSLQTLTRYGLAKRAELASRGIRARLLGMVISDGRATDYHVVDLNEVQKAVQMFESRTSQLWGVGRGQAALSELAQLGIRQLREIQDALGLAQVFTEFSQAASSVACGNALPAVVTVQPLLPAPAP